MIEKRVWNFNDNLISTCNFKCSLYYSPFPFGVAFNEHHEKWGEKDDDGRQIAIAVGGQNSKQPSTSEPLRALPILHVLS